MKQFNFKSLNRENVAYQFDSDYNAHENGFFRNCGAYISKNINEYHTYGDGMTQHSPVWAVSVDNVEDCLSSLAVDLCENQEHLDIVAKAEYHLMDDYSDRIDFLSKVKFDDSQSEYDQKYYSTELSKIGKAAKLKHDKRYEQIKPWQTGTALAVYRTMVQNYTYFGALERYNLIDSIRDAMDYAYISDEDYKKYIGFVPEIVIRQAFDAIKEMVQGFVTLKKGKSFVECMLHNLENSKQSKAA